MGLKFQIPKPIHFDPASEVRFKHAQSKQFLPLLQAMIAFCFVLQPIYVLWDCVFADESFKQILQLRAVQATIFGLFLLVSTKKNSHLFVLPLATLFFASLVISFSYVLGMVYDGFTLGLSTLLVPFMIIPLMPSIKWVIYNVITAIILSNIVMALSEVPSILQVNANFYLWTFAMLSVLLSVRYTYRSRQMFQMEQQMERIATIDELSGVSNRRHFMSKSQEVLRAHRYKRPLSVLMLDVDHFKSINDTYGHHAGDMAIKEIGSVCKEVMRVADFIARIGNDPTGENCLPLIGRLGGEEFAILLPETDIKGACVAAERLRKLMQDNVVILDDGTTIRFTISVGVSTLRLGDQRDTIESLLKRADEALYKAKGSGRNVVIAAQDIMAI